MHAARFVQAMAAVALFNGVLYLCVRQDALAADVEEDAKKYAQELKKSKDVKVRITALQELGKLGALQRSLVADIMPEIYKALEDKDAGVRAAAAQCLGQCDDPAEKAVPALVKLIKGDKEESVKIGAMRGLASMGPGAKDAVPTLREIIKNEDKKSKLGKAAQEAVKAIAGKK